MSWSQKTGGLEKQPSRNFMLKFPRRGRRSESTTNKICFAIMNSFTRAYEGFRILGVKAMRSFFKEELKYSAAMNPAIGPCTLTSVSSGVST